MATDSDSIPQHVVDAVWNASDDTVMGLGMDGLRVIIAATLDALMDDEPVQVIARDKGPGNWQRIYEAVPSDVLAALLEPNDEQRRIEAAKARGHR